VLYQLAAGEIEHDAGVLELSQWSARLAYAAMCLSLTWGALTSMGWVNRLTGRQALRSSHMVLSTLALGFAAVHILGLLLMQSEKWALAQVLVPFSTGIAFRHSLGIMAFEGMLAASIGIALRRWMTYYRWLWLHRLAYPAFAFGVLHALFSAMANGNISVLWLAGITLLIPPVTVAMLRFMPAKALAPVGLIEDAP
jgi:methionine sulfoxide reductase heme-binding subunit